MKFTDIDTGGVYEAMLEAVIPLKEVLSPWQAEAAEVARLASGNIQDIDGGLDICHRLQRLYRIMVSGLTDNQAFYDAVQKADHRTWKEFGAPPVDIALQRDLAAKLWNVDRAKGDVAMLSLGDQAKEIGRCLAERCIREGIPFVVNFGDPDFQALMLNHASEQGVRNLATAYLELTAPVTKTMSARSGLPEGEVIVPDKVKASLYASGVKGFSDRIGSGDIFYTLTVIPTRKDAEIDGISYDDYIKLFFEMCDQPWDEIKKAQAELIKEFNAASRIRITNDYGTDISMVLVDHDGSHFTFCNSVIAKNVPGSEIFSAPRRDSVEGKIVSKGRFEHNNQIVENLTLEFEKGKLVRYAADKGVDVFERAIQLDDGALYVGELGIGTNPHLRRHVANGLLVEKIGGSFHIALGHPYTYAEYGGEPVKVNNGGDSKLHWDITTMLQGCGGRIWLDDRLIMEDGRFLDRKYDVLNRGWEAVPREERPDYWKNYYDPKPVL